MGSNAQPLLIEENYSQAPLKQHSSQEIDNIYNIESWPVSSVIDQQRNDSYADIIKDLGCMETILSSMQIKQVIEINDIYIADGSVIHPKAAPCVFEYIINKSKPYFEIDANLLGISLWADSLSDLESMLQDHIAMLWDQYVLYDGEMTEDAKRLKRRVLEMFKQAL